MSCPGLIAGLLPGIDAALGVRDSIGAVIQPVSLVTRTYFLDLEKTRPAGAPEGFMLEQIERVLPSPRIVSFSQDIRLREGGAIKAGDVQLKGISKNKYRLPQLDGTTSAPNVLRLYQIGAKLYQVINVTEQYVTWDVMLRELTNQR